MGNRIFKGLVFAAIFIVTVFLTVCNKTMPQPTVLIANFKSYQSIEDFNKVVENNYDTLIVFENSNLPKNDKRPPFSIYRILLANYTMLGCKGNIEGTFFNKRLMKIDVYADDFNYFLDTLNSSLDISLTMEENILLNNVRIAICGPDISKPYLLFDAFWVSFTDIRLENGMQGWIKKYS